MLILKILAYLFVGLLLLIIVGYLFFRYRVKTTKDAYDLEDRIDKYVEKLYKEKNLKGVVVGVIKNGKTYTNGWGIKGEHDLTTPDGTTLFEIGSIGKLFTAIAMQLGVAKGDFDWQDSIRKYLNTPAIQLAETCQTQLIHLATHTSGFPSIPKLLIDKVKNMENPYLDLSKEDVYEYLATCEENKPIGNYEYSNFGMGLLGHILELKYGKKYEEIVKETICQPLKMDSTIITLSETQKTNLAHPHNEKGNPTPIWEDKVLTGAGAHLSTAEDMLKFIQANLSKDYHAISPQLISCQQPQFKGDMGLGWHLSNFWTDKLFQNAGYLWHNGGTGGSASFVAIDPKHQTGLVLLSNSAIDITNRGMWMMNLIKMHSFKSQAPTQGEVS